MAKKTGVELEFSILDDDFNKSIKEMNTMISSMKKELNLNNEVLKSSSSSVNDYQDKLDKLREQEELSRKKVEETRNAYERVKEMMGENSAETQKYKNKLIDAEVEHQKISNTIDATTKSLEKHENSLKEDETKNRELNSTLGVLNTTLGTQKEQLENLKKQYINTVLEQGKGSAQAKTLKDEIKNLSSEISVNENKLSNAEGELEKFSNAETKAGEHAITFGEMIKANLISDAIKSGLTSLVNGINNIKNSMSSAIKEGAAYADTYLTMSTTTGMSVESLQKYEAISELVDVSTETLTSSMAKNIKQMASGNEIYEQLGVSIKDHNGNLRDSEDVYWECIDAFNKMEDGAEKDAMMMDLFGKSAQDLKPLMTQGSQGIKELSDVAYGMGAILSDDMMSALGEVDDGFQIMSKTAKATGNILASAFAPSVSVLMGAVNDITGNFNNLMLAILGGDEDEIAQAVDSTVQAVERLASSIGEQVPVMVETAGKLISTIGTAIIDNLPMLAEEGAKMLSTLLNGITNSLSSIMPVAMNVLMTLVTAIVNNLPTISQAGVTLLVELVKGIAQSLPELIPQMINALLLMVETLIDNIDLIIDAGIQLIIGLAEGLLNALPDLIDKIPIIIDKLVIAITDNLPKIIEMGIVLIVKLAEGLIKAIPQLVSKIPQIIGSLINGIVNYYSKMFEKGKELLGKVKDGIVSGISGMADIGKNMVQGLWNGINNAKDWVLDKIKGFGKSILNGIKGIFGIHSPSTVFRDEVGKFLALGLGEGFTDEMKNVSEEMEDAIPNNFDINMNANPVTGDNYPNNYNYNSVTDTSNYDPGQVAPIYLTIENFNNNREQDIEDLSEELEYYRMKVNYGKGTA